MTEVLRAFPNDKPKRPSDNIWGCSIVLLILIVFIVGCVLWARQRLWEGYESDRRALCASNISQIGKALIIYSNENNGQLPPDFATLTNDQLLGMKVFVCPTSRGKPAIWSDDLQSRRTAFSNPKHNGYIYCADGLTLSDFRLDSNVVLAFELPSNHSEGLNILFCDGHVEWESTSIENVQKMLKDAEAGIRPVRFDLRRP